MLSELAVRGVGVIDEMSVVLGPGLTAVTGETGAGKTLVVGAIDLLTGGRADSALVRPGVEEAEIEGRFLTGDDELVVRRVIPRDGRSRAYVNGRLATVALLADQGADLIDLHGQHAHQSLLRGPVQRNALDQFAGIDTSALAAVIDDLRAVDAALAELGGDDRARAREIDLLRHQLGEIEAVGVVDGEEDERLDREEDMLADAVAHQEAAHAAVALLDSDSAAAEGLARALTALDGRSPFVEQLQQLAGAVADITDAVDGLRHQAEAIEDDPERLAHLRERRQALRELRRKYGDTLDEVLVWSADASRQLALLEGYDERAEALDQQRRDLLARLDVEQAKVRAAREEAAPRLAAAVAENLSDLAMAGARLEISVQGPAGDDVTMLLAANAGHEPLPLSKVASGGELARTMLALRLVLSAGPHTLVFDEVDAGIGGDTANAVGAALARLAERHQVLVVTHLAQVAAFADQHVAVSKSSVDGATVSMVRLLDPAERVTELSRMLSGKPDSSTAREHAEELLIAAGHQP